MNRTLLSREANDIIYLTESLILAMPLAFGGGMIMNSTGNIILAIVWIPGSLFWFICAENPVVGILWLCGGIVELVQYCLNNSEYSAGYLRQYSVVVSRQCHRIASFLRLVLTHISGTVFHCYSGNTVLMIELVRHNKERRSCQNGSD